MGRNDALIVLVVGGVAVGAWYLYNRSKKNKNSGGGGSNPYGGLLNIKESTSIDEILKSGNKIEGIGSGGRISSGPSQGAFVDNRMVRAYAGRARLPKIKKARSV